MAEKPLSVATLAGSRELPSIMIVQDPWLTDPKSLEKRHLTVLGIHLACRQKRDPTCQQFRLENSSWPYGKSPNDSLSNGFGNIHADLRTRKKPPGLKSTGKFEENGLFVVSTRDCACGEDGLAMVAKLSRPLYRKTDFSSESCGDPCSG